ncbi:DUF6155 family protein [Acinetobacter sp. CFCC 10889]|uniref:DUF6155 family protein n=1 Tax=Acinetobacter sp. CFCC 10889 TaxID=1775557 RepID=UPI000DCF6975|nr:DUF6155 family protein [Acinetobacter sp. CFCC 10889]
MALTDLKKFLADQSKEELQEEILILYKNFKNIKEFYDSQFSSTDSITILNKYKKQIEKEFFPTRGIGNPKLSIIRKIINDYKKVIGIHPHLIDLAFFYVEQGVQYACEYGDIHEPFYESMENMYLQALEWSSDLVYLNEVQERAKKICLQASRTGYGFQDILTDNYEQFYQ